MCMERDSGGEEEVGEEGESEGDDGEEDREVGEERKERQVVNY